MSKVSMSGSNDFCPQCLYLYGTYKENREPITGCSAGQPIAGMKGLNLWPVSGRIS